MPVLTDPRRTASRRGFFFFHARRDQMDMTTYLVRVLYSSTTLPIYQVFGTRHPDTDPSNVTRVFCFSLETCEDERLHLVGCRTYMFARPVPLKRNSKASRGVEAPRGRSRRLMSLSCGDVQYRSMTDFGAKLTRRERSSRFERSSRKRTLCWRFRQID